MKKNIVGKIHTKRKNRQPGLVMLILIPICLIITVIMILFSSLISAQLTGTSSGGGTGADADADADGTVAGGNVLDCSGIKTIKAEYMPWIKDAANIHLGGDQAMLMALIQTESTWRPTAANIGSNTHAVGLGQFQPDTARDWKEFTGGNDKHGNTWDTAYVYGPPDYKGMPPASDARFDPKRSIFAAAHYLSNTAKLESGDYFMGYQKHYHGGASGASARATMEKWYEKFKPGCKVLTPAAGSTAVLPEGKGCPAIASNAIAIAAQLTGSHNNKLNGRPFVCTDFVALSYLKAGFNISDAGTVTTGMKAWFQSKHMYFANGSGAPKLGDMIYYLSPTNKVSGHHVGVVAEVFSDHIVSREANGGHIKQTYRLINGKYVEHGGLELLGFGRLKQCQ